MSKFVRCYAADRRSSDEEECTSPRKAYENYRENGGCFSPYECSYERVEPLSIEIQWVELVSDADIKCEEF